MAETMVVVSKVKKVVKEAGFRTGGDYVEALSKRVSDMVQASIEKVKADGTKKTLGVEDLI
ncbi:MAG: hypothetical protein WC859_05440 [Elusimicrobiota bacterium]|jgi:hypothetical protein